MNRPNQSSLLTGNRRWFALALTVLLQSLSFLTLKYASMESGPMTAVLLAIALLFMLSRAVVWQKLLVGNEVSMLYPFAALVQVVILVYAVALFGESITPGNVAGLLLMLLGLRLLVRER